jgi:exonuclease VII small subunit
LKTKEEALTELNDICTSMRFHLEGLCNLRAEIGGYADRLGATGDWYYNFWSVEEGMKNVKELDKEIQHMLQEIEMARDSERKQQPSFDFTDTLKTAHSIAAKYIIK